MKIEAEALHVTVFINSTDHHGTTPLYHAIIQRCQERGVAGATVTRAAEGYGAGRQLHTTRMLELSDDLPLRIDVVDLPERIEPLLADLEEIITEGLVTVSRVRALRFLADPKK
jgi:PII-like signaling protein